ncbi:MbcA/ParS/Xre antitoxin family protein [Chelativorans salis]|uniref:MbcA/ParS/Xre antitoxin family protein n=1 Tax=Chelativorans salis TaxID=2978478 RepID=A0ABT2LNY2_9HYPH|nr:MbcA/ParS/Xre antitoxin family protein [Chelativorans sp. EGI FJ00035]MCT7376006.1 MbcA/ParS/Xre antitoxin family protein [Chelativorans sp. EGI FJ00035]
MSSALAQVLDRISQKGAIKLIDVANMLDVRPETVSRWNQGKAYPHRDTEKLLLELEYIVDQLGDFYEPNDARRWIFARQRFLDGESPADLIRVGRIDDVLSLVQKMRDGVYL